MKKDPLGILGKKITYDTEEEGVMLIRLMIECGYTFYKQEGIYDRIRHWNGLYPKTSKVVYYDFCLYFTSLNSWDIKASDILDNAKIYKKIENPDLDPFGEEDWGYVMENLKRDPLGILGKRIKYNDEEEGIKLIKYLINNGYTFYGQSGVYNRIKLWNGLYPSNFEDFSLGRVYGSCLKASDIIDSDMLNKKIKKIKNQKIDPYDEEDWGYVIDNFNPIDPFDEEIWDNDEDVYYIKKAKMLDYFFMAKKINDDYYTIDICGDIRNKKYHYNEVPDIYRELILNDKIKIRLSNVVKNYKLSTIMKLLDISIKNIRF